MPAKKQSLYPPRQINKSTKLADVLYEIRGPVLETAAELEAAGEEVLHLNIGNPAPFGFYAPDTVLQNVADHLNEAQGYVESKGIVEARTAVKDECTRIGIQGVEIDDIYLGNGVSELIVMSMQGLLNVGDEVLIPTPDYPLWSAAVTLAGGIPVHYVCDEASDWQPDLDDIKTKTNHRTVGLVVINPNNPTGAVYSRELLQEIANWAASADLVLLADEIYSKIVFDDAEYVPCASLNDQCLTLTFDGLSKAYRLAGFRSGWMILSGDKSRASDYIEGLNMLSSMRLCANAPAQYAIKQSLTGPQSILDITDEGGSLYKKRELAYDLLTDIDGITCVKPKGAFYMFPKVDISNYRIFDDEQMVLDILNSQKILLVHGTGFNYPTPDHFRMVFLPEIDKIRDALGKIKTFFEGYL